VTGELDGVSVALAVTGTGAVNAARGVEALLAAFGVERMIVVGASGALGGELAAGALVVAELVLQARDGAVDATGAADGAAAFRADVRLIEDVARVTGAGRALALTATRLADTVDEKRRLHGLTVSAAAAAFAPGLVPPGAVVVDLESAAYVAAARCAGVPWIVLRAVSDTAGEELPPILNQCRDDQGAIRRGRVARGLLARPRLLPALLALRQRVLMCARTLDRAVTALLKGSGVSAAARSGRCMTR